MGARLAYSNNLDMTRFQNYSNLEDIPVSIIPSRCDVEGCSNSLHGYSCKAKELEKRAQCSNSPIVQIYLFLESKDVPYVPYNFNGLGNIIAFLRLSEVKKLSTSGLVRDVIPIEEDYLHSVTVTRK
jgi:hypothetical protein